MKRVPIVMRWTRTNDLGLRQEAIGELGRTPKIIRREVRDHRLDCPMAVLT
jgi:hypothetical protein